MTAFTQEVLTAYIKDDLAALEHPHRMDQGIILQDLRFLFRAYGQKYKRVEDWKPAARAPSADGTLNQHGGY